MHDFRPTWDSKPIADAVDQLFDVVVEVGVRANGNGFAKRQVAQGLGQLVLLGKGRLPNQDRYDQDVPAQGRLNFAADEVARIVQTPVSLGVARVQPVIADQSKQHLAACHLFRQNFAIIEPDVSAINVLKDLVLPKVKSKLVINAPA